MFNKYKIINDIPLSLFIFHLPSCGWTLMTRSGRKVEPSSVKKHHQNHFFVLYTILILYEIIITKELSNKLITFGSCWIVNSSVFFVPLRTVVFSFKHVHLYLFTTVNFYLYILQTLKSQCSLLSLHRKLVSLYLYISSACYHLSILDLSVSLVMTILPTHVAILSLWW